MEQASRYVADAWEDAICVWLDDLHDKADNLRGHPGYEPARCTVLSVALGALQMTNEKVSRQTQNRIIAALGQVGWEQGKRTNSARFYVPGPAALDRQKARIEARRHQASVTQ